MTTERAYWWTRAAQTLSRAGLLWLALTAVALGSLVSSGSALAPSARLAAASSIGSTGKLKANGPGAPAVFPDELTHRAQGPDSEAKRIHGGGTPLGLTTAVLALSGPARADRPVVTDADKPAVRPAAFNARAPPALA
jgi:hypothetical protein